MNFNLGDFDLICLSLHMRTQKVVQLLDVVPTTIQQFRISPDFRAARW